MVFGSLLFTRETSNLNFNRYTAVTTHMCILLIRINRNEKVCFYFLFYLTRFMLFLRFDKCAVALKLWLCVKTLVTI